MEETSVKNKILIVKNSHASLEAVEKIFTQKGYEVMSVIELKPAILKTLQFRPHFIFIALDHHNPTAKQLPKVFSPSPYRTRYPFYRVTISIFDLGN